MKLYFLNRYDKRVFIADVEGYSEADDEICDYCSVRNYKIPYVRLWDEGNERWYDVGSHTEFFILVKGENEC